MQGAEELVVLDEDVDVEDVGVVDEDSVDAVVLDDDVVGAVDVGSVVDVDDVDVGSVAVPVEDDVVEIVKRPDADDDVIVDVSEAAVDTLETVSVTDNGSLVITVCDFLASAMDTSEYVPGVAAAGRVMTMVTVRPGPTVPTGVFATVELDD